jgi:hypothetical protein
MVILITRVSKKWRVFLRKTVRYGIGFFRKIFYIDTDRILNILIRNEILFYIDTDRDFKTKTRIIE